MNSDIIIKIAEAAGAAAAGFFAGLFIVFTFNRLPAQWLSEYGEKPSQELKDPNVKRIKENPWRWVFAAGLACAGVRLIFACDVPLNLQLTVAGLFACWLMIIITISDFKYMIIPDQFVLLLAVCSAGFIPLYTDTASRLGENMNQIFSSFFNVSPASGSGFWHSQALVASVLGMIIGGCTMLIVAGIGSLVSGKEAVGFGDVKLCAALGLLLGAFGIILVLLGSIILSGLIAAAGILSGRYQKNDAMPLAPCICGCAIAYIILIIPLLIK